MTRKRLGKIDPAAVEATRTRAAAAATGAGAGAAESQGQDAQKNTPQASERHARVTPPRAPIAQVAAGVGRNIEAEIHRLRTELDATKDLRTAEAEGRVLKVLDLDMVDLAHITRDRVAINRAGEDWAALKTSMAARGQQMPIEVVDLGPDAQPRYGLISGLRRMLVLRELWEETGEARHARVTAMLRAPDLSLTDRLIAMIEENEIRAGISFYERARIAALATDQGLFADTDRAVDTLFPSTHRNRRYKIRSFVEIFRALDGVLWYPQAIGERLGIELAKAIRTPAHLAAVRTMLERAGGRDPEGELQLLTRFLATAGDAPRIPKPRPLEVAWEGEHGQRITARMTPGSGRITLDLGEADQGLAAPDNETLDRLVQWLGQNLTR